MYSGIVIDGGKQAKALGFPTANIVLDDASISGIYASRVLLEGKRHDAVTYADQNRKVLESHLLDFSGDLYGETIAVELLQHLRDALPFSDEAEARAQIGQDIESARAYFMKMR
jgi:riboflavin kinase/FMN adenylyltransferase